MRLKTSADFETKSSYSFNVVVTDNGIGRAAAELLKKQRKGNKHKSKAQSIIHVRMEMFIQLHENKFSL